jgi:hypothetical protein
MVSRGRSRPRSGNWGAPTITAPIPKASLPLSDRQYKRQSRSPDLRGNKKSRDRVMCRATGDSDTRLAHQRSEFFRNRLEVET